MRDVAADRSVPKLGQLSAVSSESGRSMAGIDSLNTLISK